MIGSTADEIGLSTNLNAVSARSLQLISARKIIPLKEFLIGMVDGKDKCATCESQRVQAGGIAPHEDDKKSSMGRDPG
jgi:hypothetical protein